MADTSEFDASARDADESAGGERKAMLLKPPSRKKHEDEMEAINVQIQQLLDHRAKLQAGLSGERITGELRVIRSRKDDMLNKRKSIDKNLQKVTDNIVRQNSEMTRVESTLRNKSEERTNQTISRLEQQLKFRNFPLREEQKIVNEINALKRSKKVLDQYLGMKRDVDAMNYQARKMREEKEYHHKEYTVQKQKEDKIKHQVHADKMKCEQIKKDLDDLYEKRRTRLTEFRAQLKEHQTLVRHKNEELNRKKQEEKFLKQEAYDKELAEYESTRTLYQDEIQLCTTLLTYLQRFVTEPEHSTDISTQQNSASESPRQDLEGMHVLKKKTDDELFGAIVRPKGKRKNREKRRTLSNKPVNHTPEIFEQFSSLKLMAPSITTEVPNVLIQLEEKKLEFEELSKAGTPGSGSWNVVNYLQSMQLPSPTDPPKLYTSLSHADLSEKDSPQVVPHQAGSTCSRVEVSSIGPESAICEDSIPSTPEVQTDNQPPRFLPSTSPTLSLDSGTVSLDNGVENSKRSTSPTTSDHSTLVPDESPSSRSDSLEDNRTDSIEETTAHSLEDQAHSVGESRPHGLESTLESLEQYRRHTSAACDSNDVLDMGTLTEALPPVIDRDGGSVICPVSEPMGS